MGLHYQSKALRWAIFKGWLHSGANVKDLKTFGLRAFEEKYIRPVDLFLKDFGSLLLSDYELDKVITGVAIKAPEDLLNFSKNVW